MKKYIIALLLLTNSLLAQNPVTKDTIVNKLDEVTINKETKTFTNKNGNIKIDIANSIFKNVSNTIDLLLKLPTIQISTDKESISIIGKGNPLIYIDKQRSTIDDLKNLSVDDIKNIEIINNPSSKYESEGRSVVLITRKLSRKDGFQANFSETASLKKYYNNYLGFNSSLKKNKLELKINLNYNAQNQWESNSNDLSIPNQNILTDYLVTVTTKKQQFIIGTGIFYKINEDDYFSFNFSNRYQVDPDNFIARSHYSQNAVSNQIITHNDSDENRNFFSSFANYNKKFKKSNSQLFTGIQYSAFKLNSESEISNNYNETGFEFSQNRNQQFKVGVLTARIDFEKKFANETKLEAGGLYLSANSDTLFDIQDSDENKSQNSNYKHNESNIAAYTQLSGDIKKISYSVGLRAENTIVNSHYKTGTGTEIHKNYIDFFPKAQFNIPVDSTKTISLNYAKSIIRPDYSSTNQNETYINPYFIFAGNISLDPTITDEITTGYQYKDKTLNLRYYQSKNPVYYGFDYNNQQNIVTFKPVNFQKESGFNIEFTLPFEYKIWSSTNSLVFIKNKIEDRSAIQNESKPYLYFYSGQAFKLQKDITFSLNFWGLTNRKEGVFKRNAILVIDASTSKTWKNWTGTISLNNIFKNTIYKEKFTVDNINSKVNYYTDSHEIAIALKYTFGKIKDSSYKEKAVDENTGRIK